VVVTEDDDLVRGLATYVLRRAGYAVLEAAEGQEALTVCNHHQGPIHLLLTDVIMPRMSGPELARRLCARRPEMRVLFMSGHGEETLAPHQITEGGVLLEKPFSATALLEGVRRVLDRDRQSVTAPPR
jgi:two-component system cell cycle sensor histidine kinase/response regulator CckA